MTEIERERGKREIERERKKEEGENTAKVGRLRLKIFVACDYYLKCLHNLCS